VNPGSGSVVGLGAFETVAITNFLIIVVKNKKMADWANVSPMQYLFPKNKDPLFQKLSSYEKL
jgi:hypothetical protein